MKCHAEVFMDIFDKLIIELEFTEMDSLIYRTLIMKHNGQISTFYLFLIFVLPAKSLKIHWLFNIFHNLNSVFSGSLKRFPVLFQLNLNLSQKLKLV